MDTIVHLVDMKLPCGLWILCYFKLNVCRVVTSGAKTRGADASSIEFAHVPDPLHLTVDGGIAEDIQAETIRPGQYSRPRKPKSARVDDTTPMAISATDVALCDDVPIS